jgi:uncharacterized iron-regulated membrane protein
MDTAVSVEPETESARPAAGLYRIVWRWHFYAGLVCLPVLVVLALTGALYLFRDEINDVVFSDWRFARRPAAQALPLSESVGRALQQVPGELKEVGLPAEPGRSLRLVVMPASGETRVVYVEPSSGAVLGSMDEAWQWETIAQRLHSLELLGRWANIAVELVAGWVIVLVATGTYLWWPRGRRGGVFSVRGAPRQRLWWRDLHAVSGATVGAVVLFLAVTGMPWTALWGQQFGALTKSLGLGLPVHVWDAVPPSTLPMAAQSTVPWTMQTAHVPASTVPGPQGAPTVHAGHAGHVEGQGTAAPGAAAGTATPIGLDRAQAVFAQAGLTGGYTLRLPWGPTGAYSALAFPPRVQDQRVIHIDQYSGRVLVDVGYADYGAVAKVTEWGIAVHMGKQYGLINQLLMLAGCLALLLLAASSVVMWWKRRPPGTLAAPPRRDADRVALGVVAMAGILGVLFPPLGASMLVFAALGALLKRWRGATTGEPA